MIVIPTYGLIWGTHDITILINILYDENHDAPHSELKYDYNYNSCLDSQFHVSTGK